MRWKNKVSEQDKVYHKCKGQRGNKVYKSRNGAFLDTGMDLIGILFCPFCGVFLK